MIIALLVFNLFAFLGLTLFVFFRFKKTTSKQEFVHLSAKISDIKKKSEKFAELEFVEENFAYLSELNIFKEKITEKTVQHDNEIQNLMEAQSEFEKTSDSKMSIEDANKEFITKTNAEEEFAKKQDIVNQKAQLNTQLEEISKNLTELQNAIEEMKSKTIPDAISQFIEKEKMQPDGFETEVIDISDSHKDVNASLEGILSGVNTELTNRESTSPATEREMLKDQVFENHIKSKQIVLINGKMNQLYSCPFDINAFGISEIGGFKFYGLESIGLNYDIEKKMITGTPIKSGEHKIQIEIIRSDWSEGKPKFHRELNLTINPDPKSLWNNFPTPKDIEYYKPDEDKLFVKIEAKSGDTRKDMVAASQRGRSHAHEAKARDDDFQLYYDNNNEWYILAVADGAGSAKSSRKG